MKNLTTINQLDEQFQIHDFVEKTILQLNKDLNGLSVEALIVDFKTSYEKLHIVIDNLIPILEVLSKNSQLQQFIYQIDLKEKQWLSFLSTLEFKILAEQVIIREAQKVYLREMFKNS